MSREDYETLALDTGCIRRTMNDVRFSGWIRVIDEVPDRLCRVLAAIQNSNTHDPWLQPRSRWMLKKDNRELWTFVDSILPEELWKVKKEAEAVAEKALYALDRILSVIKGQDGVSTTAQCAERAAMVAAAGEGKPAIFRLPEQ
jgi:hypothetical protein